MADPIRCLKLFMLNRSISFIYNKITMYYNETKSLSRQRLNKSASITAFDFNYTQAKNNQNQ